jgi:hypothetical protein
MRLWIDCEFNGYGGELISMALVDEDGLEWYESLGCAAADPWVAANVIPVLDIVSTSRPLMQESLERFLGAYASVHIVSDWPDDIRYFCELLITGPGTRIKTPPLTCEVLRIDPISARPHNALADARALRLAHAVGEAQEERRRPSLTALALWRMLCDAFIAGAKFAGADMSDRLLNVRANDTAEGHASDLLGAYALENREAFIPLTTKPRPAVITYRIEQAHPTRRELSMFYTEHAYEARTYAGLGWTVTALAAADDQALARAQKGARI